jgi:hypothetical protein
MEIRVTATASRFSHGARRACFSKRVHGEGLEDEICALDDADLRKDRDLISEARKDREEVFILDDGLRDIMASLRIGGVNFRPGLR